MKKITLFLSTMMLLTLACTSSNAIVSHNNVEDITSKIEGLEGVRLNKEAKYESTIDFNNNGAGSAYLSDVKVQYAPGTNENTASLRLVSAVKANITSATEVELPGTYGFHISYVKYTGLVDFMYDVEYFYHSMGATTASGTTYYTNEYSSYLNNENRKDISAFLGEENTNGYNLFIAAKLDNIPLAYVDSLITVQPYLILNDTQEVVTSSHLRYLTPSDVENAYVSYYLSKDNNLEKLNTTDGNVYTLTKELVSGETVNLIDKNNLVVKSFTASSDGEHVFTYTRSTNEWNVTEPLVEIQRQLYKEFNDETNLDLRGWGHELNSAVTGKVYGVNGNALRYEVTSNPATDNWHIKFHRSIEFDANATYTLRYHLNVVSTEGVSEPEVSMHVDGTNASFVKVNSQGVSVVEKTFESTGGNKYVTLELGKIGTSFVLDVTKVEVIKHDYTYVDITNKDYAFNDNVTATFWDGSEGNVVAEQDKATYNITKPRPSDVGGIWVNKFGIIANHSLQANQTYRVSFDLYAEKALNRFEVLYGDGLGNDDATNNIGDGLWDRNISAGETRTYSQVFTPNRDIENFKITIHLGESLETNTFVATNLKIEQIQDVPSVSTTTFVPSQLAVGNDGESKSSLSYDNGVYTYNIERFGTSDWHTKLGIYNISLEANKAYTFEFDASSLTDVSALFMVHRIAEEWQTLAYENITFNAETKTYSFTTEVLSEAMTVELLWQFGGENKVGPADFAISNIVIYAL